VALLVTAGALVVVVLIAAGVVVALARRSHLRSWRFGVFYEGEDRTERKDP
jgi:hypothetical protein